MDLVRQFKQNGKFLEVGAGQGDLTRVFLDMGWTGVCFDIGARTRELLRKSLSSYGESVYVADSLSELKKESHDMLLAFEVLEHISDDFEALAGWSSYLKHGGILILSVPAHMSKYNDEDRRVGHIRRYDKSELIDLVKTAGFCEISVASYGFPLGNITRNISRLFDLWNLRKEEELTMEERSIRSGIERTDLLNRLSFMFNRYTMWPFVKIQKLFFSYDFGDGYVLCAKKV